MSRGMMNSMMQWKSQEMVTVGHQLPVNQYIAKWKLKRLHRAPLRARLWWRETKNDIFGFIEKDTLNSMWMPGALLWVRPPLSITLHYWGLRVTEVGSQFQYESNMMSGCRDKASKELTNQRPAFGRKSLDHDGMLIRSEGHLSEFTVAIWV